MADDGVKVTFRIEEEQLAELDKECGGNRSKFVREAVEYYLNNYKQIKLGSMADSIVEQNKKLREQLDEKQEEIDQLKSKLDQKDIEIASLIETGKNMSMALNR